MRFFSIPLDSPLHTHTITKPLERALKRTLCTLYVFLSCDQICWDILFSENLFEPENQVRSSGILVKKYAIFPEFLVVSFRKMNWFRNNNFRDIYFTNTFFSNMVMTFANCKVIFILWFPWLVSFWPQLHPQETNVVRFFYWLIFQAFLALFTLTLYYSVRPFS